MNEKKLQFLKDEVYALSLKASITRNRQKVYKDVADAEKEQFRKDLKSEIFAISEQYKSDVSVENHRLNIENLSNLISKKHGEILINNRFRIGNSQKILNVYLKYLWCLELIQPPPDMIIDGFVLSEIKKRYKQKYNSHPEILDNNFTEFDDIEIYKKIIECCEKVCLLPLCQAELEMWSEVKNGCA